MRIHLSFILPTYNERKNIREIVPEIEKLVLELKCPSEILVVDDSSPDGTGDEVRTFMKRYHNIRLVTRQKKEGMGAAIK